MSALPIRSMAASDVATRAPVRDQPAQRALGFARNIAPGFLVVLALLVLCVFGNQFALYLGGLVIIYAMSAIGLDWLMGRTGQVSIGNGALMALGGYTTAISSTKPWGAFPVALILSGLIGAAAGVIIALPSLRLKGFYFALTTLALQFIVLFAAQTYEKHTGHLSGTPVAPLRLLGHTYTYGVQYVLLLGALLIVTLILLSNMYRRLPGRMWLATKESELAASTIRVDVRRWKLKSFVGSSALIAMSGSLIAYYTGSVSSDTFSLAFAITFVVMTIVGGVGSMAGAIVGAALVTLAPQVLTTVSKSFSGSGSHWFQSNLPAINNGLYGLFVLLILLYLPRGLVPSIQAGASAGARRLVHRRQPSPWQGAGLEPSAVVMSAPALAATVVVERDPAPAAVLPAAADALVIISDLFVTYSNGARALNGVNLTIHNEETVAIVGRNGAGKSTLLRSLSGFFGTERVTRSGSILFDGRELIRRSPVQIAAFGITLVPERDKVFPSLTVAEHLRHLGNAAAAKSLLPEVWDFLERRWKSPAGLLSGGERQMLAITLAASLEPRLILIDEMSLGLAPVMIDRVGEIISNLSSRLKTTILLVEQNVAVAERLAQRIHHLQSGELRGRPDGSGRGPDADLAEREDSGDRG